MGADCDEPARICLLSVLARRDRSPVRSLPGAPGAAVPRVRPARPDCGGRARWWRAL